MTGQIVLAYSGGFGSSAALGVLARQADVIAVVVDFGTGDVDLDTVRRRAVADGAADVVVVRAGEQLADEQCLAALQANAVLLGRYPLVASLARPVLAGHLVAVAEDRGASAIAHGGDAPLATMVTDLAPGLPVLEPVAGPAAMARYAHDRRLPTEGPQVSVKRTLWGRGGENRAPLFSCTEEAEVNADAPDEVVVTFERGVPVALDGETVRVAEAVQRLGHRAGAHGVGRFDLSAGGGYEAPGAVALITAHQDLESRTLERDLARFKQGVDRRWTDLVHDGSWFSPLREPLDAFIRQAQERVSGDVRLVLHAGAVTAGHGGSSHDLRPAGSRYRPVTGRGPLGLTRHPTTQAS
ncbi:argininosuccinate synthase domain-containing protein [Amycolatopsis jiangsuensis]|uniref:argininosuccinate synthase n=1 Tax=Amycolatopsis jiangsuensis TaxID=1181879 RepID=A0A840IP86_9PSEU|nr:argininosuccinate synthase domain-containing protein [Amycolatopsis jiangsuensis]MBB4683008.1 argininosuccinate synthase [Amycolatopsis jiangsuensis]